MKDDTCDEYLPKLVSEAYKRYTIVSGRLEQCRTAIGKLRERITSADSNAGRVKVEFCCDPRVVHSHRPILEIYQSLYQLLKWPLIPKLDGRLVNHFLSELNRRYE